MAELRPTGAVTAASGTPVIVGSAPWGDDDDASYVVLKHSETLASSPPIDAVISTLPTFSGGTTDATEVWLRVEVAADAAADLLALTVEVDSPGGDFWFFSNIGELYFGGLEADGAAREVRGTLSFGDPASLATALAAGGSTLYVSVGYVGELPPTGPPPSVVTIYEIGWGTPDVEEVLVTRLWPRDDGYGLGSAHRIYPPPRRSRIVGGQS